VAAIGQCSFSSVSGVNFGSYDVCNTSHTHSTGSITYNCIALDTPITIDLSKGNATTYVPRQMRQGAYTMVSGPDCISSSS
jgi:spore coat protein U domain-containing protein, fimbrial subunit CupE1/2/3/6